MAYIVQMRTLQQTGMLRRLSTKSSTPSSTTEEDTAVALPKRATFTTKMASFFHKPKDSASSSPLRDNDTPQQHELAEKEEETKEFTAPAPRRKSVFQAPEFSSPDTAADLNTVLRARSRSIKDKDGVRIPWPGAQNETG